MKFVFILCEQQTSTVAYRRHKNWDQFCVLKSLWLGQKDIWNTKPSGEYYASGRPQWKHIASFAICQVVHPLCLAPSLKEGVLGLKGSGGHIERGWELCSMEGSQIGGCECIYPLFTLAGRPVLAFEKGNASKRDKNFDTWAQQHDVHSSTVKHFCKRVKTACKMSKTFQEGKC